MKKLLLVAALTALSIPALAGSISFTITQGAGPGITKTYNIPDAELDRLVTAYQSGANVAVNGTATKAQVIQHWIARFMQETIEFVKGTETAAAKAAVPDAAPIKPQ